MKKKIETGVLLKLKKQKLINDKDFAFWWVEQRLSFRPKGKNLLRLELMSKGVSKDIAETVLLKVDDQHLAILARKLVEKKIKGYQKSIKGKKLFNKDKKLADFKVKQKLFNHLARRGFGMEIVKKVIDEIEEKR